MTLLAVAAVAPPCFADEGVHPQAKGKVIPDKPQSVALKVNTVPGVATPAGYPVTTGVPFASRRPAMR
jgi:hypothetical protein